MDSKIFIVGWAEFSHNSRDQQKQLIEFKLEQFAKAGWSGKDPKKWGGTSTTEIPLNDFNLPLGCVAIQSGTPVGVGFLINNDLNEYYVPRQFVELRQVVANPWFAGFAVQKEFQGKGVGRSIEKWCVAKAYCLGVPKIWLCAGRDKIAHLPDLYTRWGWNTEQTLANTQGQVRYVMSKRVHC